MNTEAPMDADFLLIRHATHADLGRRLSGRGGGGLTDSGHQQAAALARCLALEHARDPFTGIHASPRTRALETAQALSAACRLPVETAPALDEIDYGEWTGRDFSELRHDPAFDAWNVERSARRPPGGESMREARDRMIAHIEQSARHSGARLLLVSHCDMIRAVLAAYLDLSLDRILRFDIAPASVSRLAVGPWGGQVLSLNESTT